MVFGIILFMTVPFYPKKEFQQCHKAVGYKLSGIHAFFYLQFLRFLFILDAFLFYNVKLNTIAC